MWFVPYFPSYKNPFPIISIPFHYLLKTTWRVSTARASHAAKCEPIYKMRWIDGYLHWTRCPFGVTLLGSCTLINQLRRAILVWTRIMLHTLFTHPLYALLPYIHLCTPVIYVYTPYIPPNTPPKHAFNTLFTPLNTTIIAKVSAPAEAGAVLDGGTLIGCLEVLFGYMFRTV